MIDSDTLKVNGAAAVGLFSTVAMKFIEVTQPILEWLVSAGTVAVLSVTVLYTVAKWKAIRARKGRKK